MANRKHKPLSGEEVKQFEHIETRVDRRVAKFQKAHDKDRMTLEQSLAWRKEQAEAENRRTE